MNKTDPFGTYEIDVHYYITYFLALMAGIKAEEALTIALAAQYIDDNPNTWPVDPQNMRDNVGNPVAINRLARYHFTQDGFDPSRNWFSGETSDQYARRQVLNPNNPQLNRLLTAANRNLRTANNQSGVTPCTRAQLFGEYLHALEDTFGHRDRDDDAIGINNGLGHAVYGKEPDYTFNDGTWRYREYRTLEMEREVFRKLQSNFGLSFTDPNTGFPIRFEDLQPVLSDFNRIRENEASAGDRFQLGSNKLNVLNAFLDRQQLGTIPFYDVAQACRNRQNYLRGLVATDYDGVILATPQSCPNARVN